MKTTKSIPGKAMKLGLAYARSVDMSKTLSMDKLPVSRNYSGDTQVALRQVGSAVACYQTTGEFAIISRPAFILLRIDSYLGNIVLPPTSLPHPPQAIPFPAKKPARRYFDAGNCSHQHLPPLKARSISTNLRMPTPPGSSIIDSGNSIG